MKKRFNEPKLKVINLQTMDVIATSTTASSTKSGNTATIYADDARSSYHKASSTTSAKPSSLWGGDDSEW